MFDDRFGRPGKGNDKGKVEGLVGYARRNFFVPVPRVASWDALNADLEHQCRARRGRRLRRATTRHPDLIDDERAGATAGVVAGQLLTESDIDDDGADDVHFD